MIKKEDVRHIAKLARLGISQKEEEKFQKDLASILDYFNSLKKVDVSTVKPTFQATEFFLKKGKSMREDKIDSQLIQPPNKLIEAAPGKKDDYIKVKAVL